MLAAYVRIGTNRRVFETPLSVAEAVSRVDSWLDQPCTRIVRSTERHWEVLRTLLVDGNATTNLVTDAHIAALAIEHGCRIATTDTDFSKFPGSSGSTRCTGDSESVQHRLACTASIAWFELRRHPSGAMASITIRDLKFRREDLVEVAL